MYTYIYINVYIYIYNICIYIHIYIYIGWWLQGRQRQEAADGQPKGYIILYCIC